MSIQPLVGHRGAPIDQDRDAPSLDPEAEQVLLLAAPDILDDIVGAVRLDGLHPPAQRRVLGLRPFDIALESRPGAPGPRRGVAARLVLPLRALRDLSLRPLDPSGERLSASARSAARVSAVAAGRSTGSGSTAAPA